MADRPKNIAASVKTRLLNLARAQHRGFDVLLVRFALERLLFRLSRSQYRDSYILKGGMLRTSGWIKTIESAACACSHAFPMRYGRGAQVICGNSAPKVWMARRLKSGT